MECTASHEELVQSLDACSPAHEAVSSAKADELPPAQMNLALERAMVMVGGSDSDFVQARYLAHTLRAGEGIQWFGISRCALERQQHALGALVRHGVALPSRSLHMRTTSLRRRALVMAAQAHGRPDWFAATELGKESRNALSAVEAAMWRQCADVEGFGGLGGVTRSTQIGSLVRAWPSKGSGTPSVAEAVSHWSSASKMPSWASSVQGGSESGAKRALAVGVSHPALGSHGVDLAVASMSFGGKGPATESVHPLHVRQALQMKKNPGSRPNPIGIEDYRSWADAGGWQSSAWATGVARPILLRNLLPVPVQLYGAFALDPRVVVQRAPEQSVAHPGDAWDPIHLAVLARPGAQPVHRPTSPEYDPIRACLGKAGAVAGASSQSGPAPLWVHGTKGTGFFYCPLVD